MRHVAIVALVRARADGPTDKLRSPAANRSGMISGSPVAAQADFDARLSAMTCDFGDETPDGRVAWIVKTCERRIVAGAGGDVLGQIVAANREKIGSKAAKVECHGRYLDHNTERRAARRKPACRNFGECAIEQT